MEIKFCCDAFRKSVARGDISINSETVTIYLQNQGYIQIEYCPFLNCGEKIKFSKKVLTKINKVW